MPSRSNGHRRHNRGEVCPDCGFIHERCLGHAKHTLPERAEKAREKWGTDGPWPCEVRPRKGQEVCGVHGGNSAQAEAKAAERVREQEAERALRRRLGHTNGVQPVLNPAKELARLAGELVAWKDEAAAMVAELTDLAITPDEGDDGTPMPLMVPAAAVDVHPFVKLAERTQERLAKVLIDMERIGIAQHHAEIEEAGLLILREAMAGLLAARGVDPGEFMTDLARELRQREAIPATVDGDAT